MFVNIVRSPKAFFLAYVGLELIFKAVAIVRNTIACRREDQLWDEYLGKRTDQDYDPVEPTSYPTSK